MWVNLSGPGTARRPVEPRCDANTPPTRPRHTTNRSNRTPPLFASIPRQTSSGPSWGLVGRVSTAKQTSGGTTTTGSAGTDKGVSGQLPGDQMGSFAAVMEQKPRSSTGRFLALPGYGRFFMTANSQRPPPELKYRNPQVVTADDRALCEVMDQVPATRPRLIRKVRSASFADPLGRETKSLSIRDRLTRRRPRGRSPFQRRRRSGGRRKPATLAPNFNAVQLRNA